MNIVESIQETLTLHTELGERTISALNAVAKHSNKKAASLFTGKKATRDHKVKADRAGLLAAAIKAPRGSGLRNQMRSSARVVKYNSKQAYSG